MTRPRLIAIGAAAAAVIAVAVVAHHAITSFALARILGAATGTNVGFGDIAIGSGQTIVRDLHVRSRAGDALLDAARIEIDYTLRDLLPGGRRAFGLRALAIDRPVFTIERHRDGTYNLPGGPGGGPGAAPALPEHPPLQLVARITGGEIRLIDDAPREPDLARQSIAGINVQATIDTAARSVVDARANVIGRENATAALLPYPLAVRGTLDVPRGYLDVHTRAARIPLRGLLNFVAHTPVVRFDGGAITHVDIVAYALSLAPFSLELGGGADLAGLRLKLDALQRPVTDLHGHFDLFGDGVTTRRIDGTVAGMPLVVRGGFYDFTNLQFRLAVGADAELDRVRSLFAFLATQPVRGPLHLEALVSGGVTNPLIRASIASHRLFYGRLPIDRLHGIVDYEDGGVTFTGVHAGYGPIAATMSGNVDVHQPDAQIEAFVDAGGPAAQIPYAQAIAPDATIGALAVVEGSGRGGFRAAGALAVAGPQSAGSGFVRIDEKGRGEFGPFLFERRDGTSLAGALRLERPVSQSAGWIDVRNYRLAIPPRLATLPGLDIPPFPDVGGVINGAVVAGGPPSDFVIAGRVHVRDAGFQTYRFGTASLDLAGTLDDLRLQHVAVDGPVGRFRGAGAASAGLFALDGTYDGSLEALEPFTGAIGAAGPVHAPVLAVVDRRGLTIQTPLAAMAGASIHGFPVDRAAGTLQIDPAGVRIVAMDADVLGRPAVAASRGRDVALSVVGLPVAALAQAGIPLEAGNVSVFGVGGFAGPTFTGSVDLAHGRAAGTPVEGWADLALAGQTVAIRDGRGAIGTTYGRIGGALDDIGSAAPRYALSASVPLGDVGAVVRDLKLPVRSLDGSFGAALTVRGAGGNPVLAGTLEVPEGSYNGLDFSAASGRFGLSTAAGLRIRVDGGRAQVHATPLQFTAGLGPGSLAVDVSSPRANLADFDDYFDTSATLDGSGSFDLALSDDGRHLRSDGRLALGGVRIRRLPLGDVRAAWGMRGDRIAGRVAADAPTGHVDAAGTIAPAAGAPLDALLHARFENDLHGRDVDLGTWLPAAGLSYPVFGRLTAAGHVSGVFPRLAVAGTASVTGGSIGPYPVAAASVRTHAEGDRIAIDDASLDLGFAKLTSSGVVGAGMTDPLSLHVHASVPDLALAARRVTRYPPDIAGSLDADALFGGSYLHPSITLGVDLEHGRYDAFSVQHIIANLETNLESVQLDGAEVAFDRGTALIAGSLPITLAPPGIGPPDAPLSLTAEARDVDLGPLAPLVPTAGTKLGGTVSGRLELGGTVESPRIFGSASLANGSYVSAVQTSPIAGLDAQVTFEGTSVSLERLHGTVGKGTVDASGRLDLPIPGAPAGGYAIDVVARGAQLNLPSYGGGTLDVNASITSGPRRPLVSGAVTAYNTTIPFATIFNASGSPENDTGPPFDLGLNLDVTAGNNVRVKSPIIDVGATGSIKLTGTLLNPRASGVLTATRGGVFSTYSRLFRIREATVTFDPAQGIVPNLDLEAAAHVSNPDPDTTRNAIGSADITVTVTGPADGYAVTYASNPPYSQTQILTLLAALPLVGANFDQPQAVGTLRGAPGESNALLPPGVTPYQTGVYTFQQSAFSLLNTQLTQRFLSPIENTATGLLGLNELDLTLDYGGRVGYTASKTIDAKRAVSVTLGQVLSYPVRTQVGFAARPDAYSSLGLSYFTQNGTPSYQNSIFGTTGTVQVQNGIQPLSNRQGFTAVLTRTYP